MWLTSGVVQTFVGTCGPAPASPGELRLQKDGDALCDGYSRVLLFPPKTLFW